MIYQLSSYAGAAPAACLSPRCFKVTSSPHSLPRSRPALKAASPPSDAAAAAYPEDEQRSSAESNFDGSHSSTSPAAATGPQGGWRPSASGTAASAEDGATSSTGQRFAAGSSPSIPSAGSPPSKLPSAVLRKIAGAADASEALELLATELAGTDWAGLTEEDGGAVVAAAVERGNFALAQSVYQAMSAAAAAAGGSANASVMSADAELGGSGLPAAWPPATPATAAALVVGLARALRTKEAAAVVESVRTRGLPTSDDVQFGYVVGCPLPADAGKPLAVVQPQEGVRQVADAYSRYEYELYSGEVASAASESLVNASSWVVAALRKAGLLQRPGAGGVHTLLVETPAGQQRSFRFATPTPDVPAKVGDRVTLVCSPQRAAFSQRRLLSATPPGARPGEALSLSNHTTRSATQLLRPPTPGAGALPQWALPAVLVLAASDAATSLIDPVLPYVAAGALAAVVTSGVAGTTLLLPRLRRLPEGVVEVQAARQKLLAQHTSLERRINQLVGEAVEDVRVLARLWQLQNKMGAVAAGGAYDARLERVAAARCSVEERVEKHVAMVDAYARVISMIEIEVEMEMEVPAAEVLGIEAQIARLGEIEELQAEWQLQAEAQDEVERLLRTSP